jgi:hypothetical protein
MKKLFITLLLFIGTLTFGQTKIKTKDIDKNINVVLDSLSKVYKVKVGGIVVDEYPNLRITSIIYYQNGELVDKVIKTETIPPKKDILGRD